MRALVQPRFAVPLGILFACLPLLAAPAVTGFTPTSGPFGTQVTITGANFTNARRVEFGQGSADFVILGSTSIRATVPTNASVGFIRVSDATSSGNSSGQFQPGPRIDELSPARGATNTQVGVSGLNFANATRVKFGTLPAAFTITGAGSLLATVPYGATNAPVTVQTPAGIAASSADFVVTTAAPIVDGFNPAVGAPGATIYLSGLNFVGVTAVRFGNVNAATFGVPTSGDIQVVVPANAPTAPITVVTAKGSGVSTNSFLVSYAPVITNFTPQIGRPGSEVRLSGINFTNLTGISVGGVPATSFGPGTVQGEWKATVPATAVTGPLRVTTVVGGVSRTGTSTVPFTVTSAPVITSFTPAEGFPDAGITVLGVNLSNGPTQLYLGTPPMRVTKLQLTPNYILAYVPTGAVSGPLTLSNPYGTFTTPEAFSVLNQRPFLTGFSPAGGPRGTTVQLTGYGFVNPITVRFNGTAAAETSATSLYGMSVTVPPDATTGPITVTSATGTTTNLNRFEVPPRLSTLSPTTGFVGDTVTLTGRSFTNTFALAFGDVPAEFTYVGDTQLLAVVPQEAITGPLRVTTPAGTVLSYESFKVRPRVLSVEPPLGPNGTPVVLRGTTLSNVTAITFNGRPATFGILSSTEIHTLVPAAATTGPIKLTTPTDSFTTTSNFVVTTSSDLHLGSTADQTLMEPGDFVNVRLSVTNRGSSAVTGVRLTNALPAGLLLESISASQGTWTEAGGTVTVDVGVLLTNGFAHVDLRAQGLAEGVWTNRTAVGSREPDWAIADNRSENRLVVLANPHRILEADPLAGAHAIALRWPTSAVPLRLQVTAALAATNAWLSVATPPTATGAWNRVTYPTTNGLRLFRLATPP